MRVWKGMLLLVLLCMLACVSAQAEGVQAEALLNGLLSAVPAPGV